MKQQEGLEEGYGEESLRDRMQGLDGPRVLWGRVGALVFLVGWAFVLGRCSAPSGVQPEELSRVNRELTAAKEQLEEAREQRARPSPSPSPQATNSPGPSPSPSPTSQVHVVKSGDTLRGISLRYYKTPNLANVIAEANDVDSSSLKVGQQLTIPPKPEEE